jgi:hypothetical protein
MHHQLQKQRQQHILLFISPLLTPWVFLSVTFNKRAFRSNSKRACIVFSIRLAQKSYIFLLARQVIHFFRRRISLRLLYAALPCACMQNKMLIGRPSLSVLLLSPAYHRFAPLEIKDAPRPNLRGVSRTSFARL